MHLHDIIFDQVRAVFDCHSTVAKVGAEFFVSHADTSRRDVTISSAYVRIEKLLFSATTLRLHWPNLKAFVFVALRRGEFGGDRQIDLADGEDVGVVHITLTRLFIVLRHLELVACSHNLGLGLATFGRFLHRRFFWLLVIL